MYMYLSVIYIHCFTEFPGPRSPSSSRILCNTWSLLTLCLYHSLIILYTVRRLVSITLHVLFWFVDNSYKFVSDINFKRAKHQHHLVCVHAKNEQKSAYKGSQTGEVTEESSRLLSTSLDSLALSHRVESVLPRGTG